MLAPYVRQVIVINSPSQVMTGSSGAARWLFTTHPDGIPDAPVVHYTSASFTKVPVGETLLTQFVKQPDAALSTARHKM